MKKMKYPKLWDSSMPSNWERFYELQQFAGLHDKNGREIYEGDSIVIKSFIPSEDAIYDELKADYDKYDDLEGDVVFQDGMWGIDTGSAHVGFVPIGSIEQKDLEVIGNIHENPELL